MHLNLSEVLDLNNEDFRLFFDKLVEQELLLIESKGIEYSGEGDRFRNFKRIGNELDISPEKICFVYLRKHIDGILDYLNKLDSGEEIVQSEPIIGRIQDARNYLALLAACISEQNNCVDK